jgi:hypothetical protein
MAKCKGSLLVHVKAWVVREQGKEGWEAVAAALPAADRAVLTGLLLGGGWYPVGIWNRSLNAYNERFAPSERERQRSMTEMSAWVAQEDLSTIFKVLLRIATPAMVLERTPGLWSRYFDVGQIKARELGERRWEMVLEAPVGSDDDSPGENTCKYGVPGWLTRALDLSGARPQIAKTRCRLRGAPTCGYEVKW